MAKYGKKAQSSVKQAMEKKKKERSRAAGPKRK